MMPLPLLFAWWIVERAMLVSSILLGVRFLMKCRWTKADEERNDFKLWALEMKNRERI